MAGVSVVGGVDSDSVAMTTFAQNFPESRWARESFAEDVNLDQLSKVVGRVDLLLASPECTNHTHARGAAPLDEGSRNKAFQVVRYAEALSPRWVIVENVVNMQAWGDYESFINRLADQGYKTRVVKLDAAKFGVPQSRRRLFILFDLERMPDEIRTPVSNGLRKASEVVDFEGEYRWSPLVTPNRAAATLQRAARARAQLGDGVPFLLVYYGTDKAGGWQPLDVPLRTVTTLDRFAIVKWVGLEPYMRMLQPEELKRAMGLDASVGGRLFSLSHGTRRDKIRLLGNAVCAPVMKSLVSQLCHGT